MALEWPHNTFSLLPSDSSVAKLYSFFPIISRSTSNSSRPSHSSLSYPDIISSSSYSLRLAICIRLLAHIIFFTRRNDTCYLFLSSLDYKSMEGLSLYLFIFTSNMCNVHKPKIWMKKSKHFLFSNCKKYLHLKIISALLSSFKMYSMFKST